MGKGSLLSMVPAENTTDTSITVSAVEQHKNSFDVFSENR